MKLEYSLHGPNGWDRKLDWSCEFANKPHAPIRGDSIRIACEHCDFEQVVTWGLFCSQRGHIADSQCEDMHESLILDLITKALV